MQAVHTLAPLPALETRRFIAGMRVVIVMLCTLVLVSEDAVHGARVGVLLGNALWACGVLLLEMQGRPLGRSLLHFWIDVSWTLLLLRVEPLGAEVLVFSFILPVVMASIGHGVRHGVGLSVCATVGWVCCLDHPSLLATLGVLTLAPCAALVARPVGQLRRRWGVLQKISVEFDPRRGCTVLAHGLTLRLRQVTGAALVAMVLPRSSQTPAVFSTARDGEVRVSDSIHALLEGLLQRLAPVPLSYQPRRFWGLMGGVFVYTAQSAGPTSAATLTELSSLLDMDSMVLLPLHRFGDAHGHVLLGWERQDRMRWDAAALAQLAPYLSRLVEQAVMVDELHDEIATQTRAGVGRDMHDSAIQPYLGLKYAVEGLAQRVAPNDPLHTDVAMLVDLVNQEVQALRHTISSLRGGVGERGDTWVPALRQQVQRFSRLFGIHIHLNCPDVLAAERLLGASLCHMVNESLNNVRKHTCARNAWVSIEQGLHQVSLRVADDAGSMVGQAMPAFVPRSLSERVAELGGTLTVGRRGSLDTELHFLIPH